MYEFNQTVCSRSLRTATFVMERALKLYNAEAAVSAEGAVADDCYGV
jgi:hypothetical protein